MPPAQEARGKCHRGTLNTRRRNCFSTMCFFKAALYSVSLPHQSRPTGSWGYATTQQTVAIFKYEQMVYLQHCSSIIYYVPHLWQIFQHYFSIFATVTASLVLSHPKKTLQIYCFLPLWIHPHIQQTFDNTFHIANISHLRCKSNCKN